MQQILKISMNELHAHSGILLYRKIWAKILLLALFVGAIGPLEIHLQPEESEPVIAAEFNDGLVRASTLYTKDSLQLKPRLTARLEGGDAAYESETIFLSEIYTTDFPFDAVEMDWEEVRPEGTAMELWVRFQTLEGRWSDWFEIHENIDYRDGDELDLKEASAIVPSARSQAIQYKVKMQSASGKATPRLQAMQFHYIDASLPSASSAEQDVSLESIKSGKTSLRSLTEGILLSKLTFGTGEIEVIPRSEWEADESWRLSSYYGIEEAEETIEETIEESIGSEEDASKNGEEMTLEELYPEEFEIERTVTENEQGNDLYWSLEYAANIEKVIVHHTAGEITTDPESTIRAIYYYHAVRRGWGDIGYNYIVANGKIYEGRYGGEKVVAGHASGYNTGSIGIAVIGNYEEDPVSFDDIDALSRLIKTKAELYNIDVDGMSRFRGELSFNVMGHRDAGKTLCPGANLYKLLPTLRELIANGITDLEGALSDTTVDEAYAFVNTNAYEALILNPEETAYFELKLKNIGQETWNQDTFLVADRNAIAEALVHLIKEEDSSVSLAHMEESSVAPGETATFKIYGEAKIRGGFERFEITPLFNGTKKTDHYLDLPVYVHQPTLSYDMIEVNVPKGRLKPGETATGTITLQNTGNVNWYRESDYPMVLGTSSPHNRKSQFLSGDGNRYASLNEEIVQPGETGTFTLSLTVPKSSGYYTEYATPLMEGVDWLEGEEVQFQLVVYNDAIQAEFMDMNDDMTFAPGEKKQVWIDWSNIGESTWSREKFSGGTVHHPSIHITTPTLEESSVAPGETGRLSFYVTAPEEPSNYSFYVRPRHKGQNVTSRHLKVSFAVEEGVEASAVGIDQESIRVKLSVKTEEFGNLIVTADGNFSVEVEGETVLEAQAGEEVEVRWSGDAYQVLQGEQALVVSAYPRFVPENEDVILEITNYENRPSWNTSLNDNRFRGALEIREDDGALIVINELPMQMYLRGIAEATNSEPTEKLKAMAIVARSYARYYLEKDEKFPGKPYDASDDPDEFQKYLGYGYEVRAPNWVDAIEDTAGLVVTYNGELVKTPYFSSSDGTATKSAEEVWGWTTTPYLVSVPDPLCESTAFSGHGVGLSGCGATAAAEDGHTYKEIIQYYYTGVEIEVK